MKRPARLSPLLRDPSTATTVTVGVQETTITPGCEDREPLVADEPSSQSPPCVFDIGEHIGCGGGGPKSPTHHDRTIQSGRKFPVPVRRRRRRPSFARKEIAALELPPAVLPMDDAEAAESDDWDDDDDDTSSAADASPLVDAAWERIVARHSVFSKPQTTAKSPTERDGEHVSAAQESAFAKEEEVGNGQLLGDNTTWRRDACSGADGVWCFSAHRIPREVHGSLSEVGDCVSVLYSQFDKDVRPSLPGSPDWTREINPGCAPCGYWAIEKCSTFRRVMERLAVSSSAEERRVKTAKLQWVVDKKRAMTARRTDFIEGPLQDGWC